MATVKVHSRRLRVRHQVLRSKGGRGLCSFDGRCKAEDVGLDLRGLRLSTGSWAALEFGPQDILGCLKTLNPKP